MLNDHFKVYIAGPITGIVDGNKKGFYEMEAHLDSIGVDSYNPRREEIPNTCPEHLISRTMMKVSIRHLISECDAVVLLKGWKKSVGAVIEETLARYLGYTIYDYEFNRLN